MFQLLNCPLINQLELKEMVYRAAWWGVLSRELMWSISLGCDCCGKRISGSAQFFHNRSVRSFRGSTSTECYATARAARHRTLNPVCTSIPFLEWWLRWFCRRNIIGCWLAWCMPPPRKIILTTDVCWRRILDIVALVVSICHLWRQQCNSSVVQGAMCLVRKTYILLLWVTNWLMLRISV